MIPYGRQSISEDDIAAVADVLRSDLLTQGPMVPRFERAIADYAHVPHAVAVNSATSALHIACMALDVGPGDRVWTSPNTFVASANCARYCGGEVDFVDIDPVTYNMSTVQLAAKLEVSEKVGTLPKIVIPVHFSGQPCDMAAIHDLARRYGFRIIEDASHAIGARYRDTIVGDCAYSDVTIFSFHPVKIITTAEGGLATTRSVELARRMQLLRSHGVTRERHEMNVQPEGPWQYEQHLLGYNYRMTEVHAALGMSQFRNLDSWVARRHVLADRYDRALADLPLKRPVRVPESYSALHLYCIQVENRRTVFEALRAAGVGVDVHYIPVHTQPYYTKLGFAPGMFPEAERYYARAISVPMYAGLADGDQDRVVAEIRCALRS